MSGETEGNVSGWTTDTLHQHMLIQINDMRAMLQERYETQTKAVAAAFEAQQLAMQTALTAAETAVSKALESAEKAVIKAETAADKRFESVNEFRGQLTDQAATFMPRAEAEAVNLRLSERQAEMLSASQLFVTRDESHAEIARITERTQELADRMNRNEGRGTGINAAWIYAVGAIAAVGTIVSLYLALRTGA